MIDVYKGALFIESIESEAGVSEGAIIYYKGFRKIKKDIDGVLYINIKTGR